MGVQTKALLGKLQVAEQARAQQSQEGQRTSISSGVYPSCSRYRCSDSFSNRWRSSVLFRPPAASRLASSLPISSGSRLYQSLMHCAARARACRAGGGAKQGPGMCSPGAGSEMAATAVARARRAEARNPAARACGGPLRRRAGAAAACRRRATRTAQTSGRRQNSTQSCCAMRTASAPGVWSPCGSPPAGVRCAEQRGPAHSISVQ